MPTIHTIHDDDDNKRRAPHGPPNASPGNDQEPRVPDDAAADLDDDQADSGPDRDHERLG